MKVIKLEKVTIEVVEMGEHIIQAGFNSLLGRKHKVNVVKVRINSFYSNNFSEDLSLNLMVGDVIEVKVKKEKK